MINKLSQMKKMAVNLKNDIDKKKKGGKEKVVDKGTLPDVSSGTKEKYFQGAFAKMKAKNAIRSGKTEVAYAHKGAKLDKGNKKGDYTVQFSGTENPRAKQRIFKYSDSNVNPNKNKPMLAKKTVTTGLERVNERAIRNERDKQ